MVRIVVLQRSHLFGRLSIGLKDRQEYNLMSFRKNGKKNGKKKMAKKYWGFLGFYGLPKI